LRIRVIFKLKNRGGTIAFHHQHLLAQLIRGMLVKTNDKKFMDFKAYNFSGLKGQTRISRKGLHFFSSRITLVIASPNQDFLDLIVHSIFEFKELQVGGLTLEPESVEREEQVAIEGPVKFICISPIVLMKPNFGDQESKRFIHPSSDEFSDLLYESIMNRMAKETDFSQEELESFYKFQLVPDAKYLERMDKNQKKFARIYSVYDQDVRYEVRGYTFPFTLYAAKEVLEFIFAIGLGHFTYKGFGMLDLAHQNPIARSVSYGANVSSNS